MMRSIIPGCLLALLLPLTPVLSQTSVRLSGGVVKASHLVGDRVNPFDELLGVNVRSNLFKDVRLSVATAMTPRYRFRLEGELAMGTLTVTDEDTGESTKLTDLRTVTIQGIFEGTLVPHLEWQAGLGQILYRPAERRGLFQDGGPARWMLTVGLVRRFTLSPTLAITAGARYDYHQFITTTLKERDFSQYQAIHRGSFSIGLERAFP